MEKEIECPFCDGKALLTIEKDTLKYKGEEMLLDTYFYRCNQCGEEFTTNESDSKTLEQIGLT